MLRPSFLFQLKYPRVPNSTFNFLFSIVTFPVIKACALISAQSSNLGFKCAISGFCKNASLLNGLNKPEVFRLFYYR